MRWETALAQKENEPRSGLKKGISADFTDYADFCRVGEPPVRDAVFIGRLSIGLQGKKEWLGFLELKDPGALLELVAVMELSVVRGSLDPHFVDDFEPAVSESAQGIGSFGDEADNKAWPRRSERDSAQQKGAWRDGGVCHEPSVPLPTRQNLRNL
jgi:hypothetical protein